MIILKEEGVCSMLWWKIEKDMEMKSGKAESIDQDLLRASVIVMYTIFNDFFSLIVMMLTHNNNDETRRNIY